MIEKTAYILTLTEVFDATAAAHPDAVHRVESLEEQADGTMEWVNMADAKVIILKGEKALYVDEIDGYQLLEDLDTLTHATVRLVGLESVDED
jgi:hypothetical protein